MKLHDRIVIECTADLKDRVEKALRVEAQRGVKVPNMSEKGRELFTRYCDEMLLPATHPRNTGGK